MDFLLLPPSILPFVHFIQFVPLVLLSLDMIYKNSISGHALGRLQVKVKERNVGNKVAHVYKFLQIK